MYKVKSSNFDFHSELTDSTFTGALRQARGRGFEAHIYFDDPNGETKLVASWSPLYGLQIR